MPTVFFRPKRNRRRVDVAKKTGEITAAVRAQVPTLLKLVAILTVCVGLVFGAREGWHWATTSRTFALADVQVLGQSEATDVELVRLGGILLGQNLVRMDVSAMERSIATHPWVKSVRVTRHFPSRLTVEVEEHRPVALLSLGELYVVNEDSVPFKRLKAGDGFDLPVITGMDRGSFGELRSEGLETLRTAVALIEAYGTEPAIAKQPLAEVKLHPEGVTAVTTDGQEIEFGEGEVTAKLRRLSRVRQELHARAMVAEVIRLDNRSRPSWVAVQVATKKP